MRRQARAGLLALLGCIAPLVLARSDATTSNPVTLPAPPSSTGTPPPQPKTSDNATSSSSSKKSDTSGLVQYYFVFIALIVICAGFFILFMLRRKHHRGLRNRSGREEALQRDLGSASSQARARYDQRRYWQGRWRSAEASREEGLDEHGEAPPPYVPKRRSEEGQEDATQPAVPLQTLSRDAAGLKPPDYSEHYQQELDPQGRASVASASSSRIPETRTQSP